MSTNLDSHFPIHVQPGTLKRLNLTDIPWAEYVPKGNPESSSEFAFGYGDSNAVMIIDCYYQDVGDMVRALLGYAWYSSGTGNLSRVLPFAHPLFPWLYCSRITRIKGMGFTGKFLATFPASGLFGVSYGTGPAAQYARARLTCLFTGLDYDVISDVDLAVKYGNLEYWRFVEKRAPPGVRTLSRDRQQWRWAETSATGPVGGQAIDAPIGQILPQANLLWVWNKVPESYVLDGKLFPANIYKSVATVNNAPFPPITGSFADPTQQFPTGTLLLHPPKITPRTAPVPPQALGLLATQPSRLLDIEIPVVQFDPDPGTNPVTTRGHNLCPSATDNLWYKVQSTGTTPRTIFKLTDFTQIFKPIN